MSAMKTFLVGGAVRDGLLGLPVKDRDWVVVGATEQDMLDAGFKPVGADFPVFLEPDSGEEFALARKERKVAAGYNGFEVDFDPSVTLEDDLFRRDLTVNAMARDPDTKELFDPHGGLQDLCDGVLRHVSDAFAEDPVRVLRVARFAARYGFKVAPDTMELMKKLVTDGELDALVPERVWAEFWKAMGEDEPTRFFWTLQACGAKEKLFPEVRNLASAGFHVTKSALRAAPTLTRVALLFAESKPKEVQALLERLKAPADVQKFVMKFLKLFAAITKTTSRPGEFAVWNMDPTKMMKLFKELDAWRQPDDVYALSALFGTFDGERQKRMDSVLKAFRAARKVTFATLPESKQQLKGAAVGKALDRARRAKVKSAM